MKLTKVCRKNIEAWLGGARLIANKGGTRSGKTYSLISFFVSLCITNKSKRVIDVVSESMPHLKRGALNDMEEILNNENLVEGVHYEYNRSDKVFLFKGGSSMRFYSADDWGKVKGPGRDILFINECNRIPYEVYRQLAVRTRQTIFLDWNPDSEFWYEQKGLNIKENTVEIHSTYKDNPFLSGVQIAEIESNKDDENWWKVYGLGQVGRPQGVIFTRWQQCREVPEGAKLVGRGLDFGFTNDPTTIIDVYLHDGKLWLDERCWQVGMTNDMIASELRGLPGWTVADCAEPKSIAEVRNYGVRSIEPSEKGADSVRAGIQVMQRYEIMITQRSLNLIKEFRNYKWKEDKITGEQLKEPIDKFNHGIDAVRYVCLSKLAEKPIIKRPTIKMKRR